MARSKELLYLLLLCKILKLALSFQLWVKVEGEDLLLIKPLIIIKWRPQVEWIPEAQLFDLKLSQNAP